MILPGTGRGTAEGGGGALPQTVSPVAYTARKLRKSMSLPEAMLWQRLRGNACGVKVRRQHPVGSYVVDFFCRDLSLVIEIDGAIHDGRCEDDADRDRYLAERGLKILRVPAADILRDADGIAASIAALAAPPLHQPSAGPPPRSGEDQE